MRLEGTSTRVPVLGLRPTRGCLWRVRKLPNPRISILSPERSERTMLSKIASTITSESLRVISTTRETSSINSAFVMYLPLRSGLPAFSFHSDIHHLFDSEGGCRGVALVILQPGSLLVVAERANAQSDLFLAFVQLDNLKVHFLADRQRGFFTAAVRSRRDLGTMAQSLDARSEFHEHSEVA